MPGLRKSPRGRAHGKPLQYSGLENPMDREAWWATVDRVAKGRTLLKQLSTHAHIRYITEAERRHCQKFWL